MEDQDFPIIKKSVERSSKIKDQDPFEVGLLRQNYNFKGESVKFQEHRFRCAHFP